MASTGALTALGAEPPLFGLGNRAELGEEWVVPDRRTAAT